MIQESMLDNSYQRFALLVTTPFLLSVALVSD
jgi:hypothetical protein